MTSKSAEEEVQKLKELEARIKAPCIWGRIIGGLRVEDLQDKRFDEAVNFLKEHYLNEEITYRSVKILEDKESTDEFAHNARVWLKDKASYAVIKEGTGALIGVMITRPQEKASFSRTFSRVKLTYSKKYSEVMTFLNAIEKPVDLFTELGVKKYIKIYLIALLPSYRHRGIAMEVIRCVMTSAKNSGIPAIVGIFTTGRSQVIAEKLGFIKFNEIFYVRYLVDDEMLFTDTGLGNYGAAIMGLRIEGVEEPESDTKLNSSSSKHLAAMSSKSLEKID